MTIPYPEKYMKPELGIGRLANYQGVQAGGLIVSVGGLGFGVGAQVTEDVVTTYKDGQLYSISYVKSYVEEIPYRDVEEADKHREHEMVLILYKGVIWVKADEGALAGENVKALPTGNFGKATISSDPATTPPDTVVGIFKTAASAGNLAVSQINLP